jgi:hypothetical protein
LTKGLPSGQEPKVVNITSYQDGCSIKVQKENADEWIPSPSCTKSKAESALTSSLSPLASFTDGSVKVTRKSMRLSPIHSALLPEFDHYLYLDMNGMELYYIIQ